MVRRRRREHASICPDHVAAVPLKPCSSNRGGPEPDLVDVEAGAIDGTRVMCLPQVQRTSRSMASVTAVVAATVQLDVARAIGTQLQHLHAG